MLCIDFTTIDLRHFSKMVYFLRGLVSFQCPRTWTRVIILLKNCQFGVQTINFKMESNMMHRFSNNSNMAACPENAWCGDYRQGGGILLNEWSYCPNQIITRATTGPGAKCSAGPPSHTHVCTTHRRIQVKTGSFISSFRSFIIGSGCLKLMSHVSLYIMYVHSLKQGYSWVPFGKFFNNLSQVMHIKDPERFEFEWGFYALSASKATYLKEKGVVSR